MARKRGGVAGIWDRNKKIIKPAATFLAGTFGTPALGAAVGAAMSGLDREGKSGIGFDLKKGAIGGVQGYGMGRLGAGIGQAAGIGKIGAMERAGNAIGGGANSLKAGVMNRLGVGAANGAANASPTALSHASSNSALLRPAVSVSQPVAGIGNVSLATAPARDFLAEGVMQQAATGGGFGGGFSLPGMLSDGKTLAALGNTAVGGMNAYNQNQATQMQRAAYAAQQAQMERSNRLEDEERARRNSMDPARAALLAQLFAQLGLGTGRVA